MSDDPDDPRYDCQRCWTNVDVLFYVGYETSIETERRNTGEDVPRWICGDCMDTALTSSGRH